MKGEKKSGVHNRMIQLAIVTVLTIILVGAFLYVYFTTPNEPKAAIVDQLSSSTLSENSRHENQTFVDLAKSYLYERFSRVDYYSDNATVDQYRRLSSSGYKLILWRAHSALNVNLSYVAISASEKYTRYHEDYGSYIDNGQVVACNITGDPTFYFAITPEFIRDVMNGRFEDTVIILMSCNGLKTGYYDTAQSFVEKGVKAFISWDGWVDKTDNDNGMSLFLDYIINGNHTVAQAVSKIPRYNSTLFGSCNLDYYPKNSDVGNYKIPDYRVNRSASSVINGTFALSTVVKRYKKPVFTSLRVIVG